MISRAVNGVPTSTMAALLLSVFTVSIGFGIVLPLLPYSIEQLLGGGSSQVARSTGLLTGLYMVSVFLFAPVWGLISDLYGRRRVLLVGLIGFGVTTLTFALVANFAAIYVERALSGLFAAAVTPVALATIGDLSTSEKARARQLTFISLAGISGLLLGPMLGVFIVTSTGNLLPHVHATGPLTLPLAATAVLAFLAAICAASTIPDTKRDVGTDKRKHSILGGTTGLSPKLLFWRLSSRPEWACLRSDLRCAGNRISV
jgi:MFS family permease